MASWTFFNKWKSRQLNGNSTNFSSATAVKLIIFSTSGNAPTSYTGDSGAAMVSDLTGTDGCVEVTGTNYARTAFGSMTVSAPASGVVTVSGTAITYAQSSSGFSTGRYLVLADVSSASDSTSPVIMTCDLGAAFGNVAGALTINTDTGNAIFTLT